MIGIRKMLSVLTVGAMTSIAAAAAPAVGDDGVKVGDKAPVFSLKCTEGKTHKLEDLMKDDHIVVLEWFNPECPFVVKHHHHNKTMRDTYRAFKDQKVRWVAINSGAPGLQGAGLEKNKKYHADWEMEFPILFDEDGKVGKAYGAAVSPHMFVIAKGKIAYMGAIDDNSSARTLGKTNYVHEALSALINGETIKVTSSRPYGCSVKYAPSR